MGVTYSAQITAPHYCAGLELNDQNICTWSAPILQWMRGKHLWDIADFCYRKGYKITVERNPF